MEPRDLQEAVERSDLVVCGDVIRQSPELRAAQRSRPSQRGVHHGIPLEHAAQRGQSLDRMDRWFDGSMTTRSHRQIISTETRHTASMEAATTTRVRPWSEEWTCAPGRVPGGTMLAGALVIALAVLVGACGTDSGSAAPATSGHSGSVAVEKVADLSRPTAFAVRPGDDPSLVHIATQDGSVYRLDVRTGTTARVASFADRTEDEGERGLLGLAFAPNGDEMYAHFTDRDGDTVVMVIPFRNGIADMTDERVLLTVDQPFANHNGGQLAVDADGNLLIALGDGGGAGDPLGTAQNTASLLGKILRIRPEPPGAARPYSIPADNPFARSSTTAPEIAFLGLRNPWRFSIDAVTGDYWIGDVGQNRFEEINRVSADALGANFGWNVKEASAPFQGSTSEVLTDPVHEWASRGGSSAIGGFVYRGDAIPALRGRYVFADLAQRGLFVLDPADASVERLDVTVERVVGFGLDAAGELYVLSYDSGVYRLVLSG